MVLEGGLLDTYFRSHLTDGVRPCLYQLIGMFHPFSNRGLLISLDLLSRPGRLLRRIPLLPCFCSCWAFVPDFLAHDSLVVVLDQFQLPFLIDIPGDDVSARSLALITSPT